MSHLELPTTITPSRAELGARCHRRHFLSDTLNRARYRSASLEFGSVVHAGIAAHWLERDVVKAITDDWHSRFEVLASGQHELPSDEKVSRAMALGMMEYYTANAQLAGPFSNQGNWKRVDVEQRFEIPLRDAKLSFQCDRIVYDMEQNWLVVVDSKTAARLDSRWDRQWETSLQMKLYKAGVKQVLQTGGRVDIIVEGLLKHIPSEIRYYVCPDWSDMMLAEAIHNAHIIAAMDADVINQAMTEPALVMPVHRDGQDRPEVKLVVNQDRAEELAVRYTPVNYMDCYSYGIECPFRRICTADVDERVGILRGEYFINTEETY